jgi:glycosyltransferase involved in cell wall biosynthesis
VCVPSRREGYGLAAREAMAYGRPLVATNVGGLADLEGGALLVSPGELRGAITRLLSDRDERERLGRAGRELARARFSHEATAVGLIEVYRDAARR